MSKGKYGMGHGMDTVMMRVWEQAIAEGIVTEEQVSRISEIAIKISLDMVKEAVVELEMESATGGNPLKVRRVRPHVGILDDDDETVH